MFKISFFKCSLYFSFLVCFGFIISLLVKSNSSKKIAVTVNLVKWISAYLWQIKIEFVIAFIPVFWVTASMDFRKFMIQIDLSPLAYSVLCSLSILTFQVISREHAQQGFYPNTNLLNILLPPLFTSVAESSFVISVLFLREWFKFQRYIFRLTLLTPTSKIAYISYLRSFYMLLLAF